MKRFYHLSDHTGSRRIRLSDFPLSVGGGEVADIVLEGCRKEQLVAHIALSQGHAYVQPADSDRQLFHNGEYLGESAWLKSGDQVQFGSELIVWTVTGDQVQISVQTVPEQTAVVDTPSVEVKTASQRPPLPVAEVAAATGDHRTLKRVAAGVFLLLITVAAFLLLSVPVRIQVEPPPGNLSIGGFPPPIPLGERYLVYPGRYRLQAELAGYYPLEEELNIERGGPSSFQRAMRELPGLVKIDVRPAVPFRLQVDGADTEVRDGIARIDRGLHTLSIHSQRYLSREQPFEVKGLGQPQQVGFELQPAWADIIIDSQPPGAEVLVDEVVAGITPLSLELLQGEHRIVFRKPLYKDAHALLSVLAGHADRLGPVELEPADGQVTLESVPSAVTVQVDGKYQGVTPLVLTLASTGNHRLRLSKPGYAVMEKEISVEPEERQTLGLSLEPEYGTVFIHTVPADAKIEIDGKTFGKAGGRLRLTTTDHRVTVSKPGYITHSTTIKPRASASQTLNITLQTRAQATAGSIPEQLRAPAGQLLRLVRPGGAFTLGASRREPGRRANENHRRVELTRPFYFAEKEVTNAQYRRYKPAHSSGSAEGVSLDGDDHPVVNISWEDAARYCNWLSKQQGLPPAYREQGGVMELVRPVTGGYRLPTEVEWAYVARVLSGNPPARYPWNGVYPPQSLAGNFADARISDTLAAVVPGYNDGYRATAPVGSFAAFPAGFYDLGGNAAEWVNDYYTVYPGGGDKPVKDPVGPLKGEHHVVRGSSWRHGSITELRLSYRDYSNKPRSDLGFRVARYAE